MKGKKIPYMQSPLIAFLLAMTAGIIDGYTFFTTQSFATFQSGNIIALAYFISAGTEDLAINPYAISLLSFGIGSMCFTIMKDFFKRKNRVWSFATLAVEMVVIVLLVTYVSYDMRGREETYLPHYVSWVMSFIAGFQGAFHIINGKPYRSIALTSTLQSSFNYLAKMLISSGKEMKTASYDSLCFFIILFCFGFGAYVSITFIEIFGIFTLLVAIVPLSIIFIYAYIMHVKNKKIPVDPD